MNETAPDLPSRGLSSFDETVSIDNFLEDQSKINHFRTWRELEIAKIIATFIVLFSVIVMYGWILNIGFLDKYFPANLLMNFIVAVLFFISGIALFFMTKLRQGHREIPQVVLPATSIFILLIASMLLASSFIKIRTGVETLLLESPRLSFDVTVTKAQEVPTMISFIVFALVGILTLMSQKRIGVFYFPVGGLIALVGIVAIVGYILNLTALFYQIDGLSSPISLGSAILFILLGAGLILVGVRDH